jgi:hypothetical protein
LITLSISDLADKVEYTAMLFEKFFVPAGKAVGMTRIFAICSTLAESSPMVVL